jgi:hypothetical protein
VILEMIRREKANVFRCDGTVLRPIEARRYRIYFDGVQQTQAVYVNDMAGFIRLLRNRDKWPTTWEAIHEDEYTERREGLVEIVKGELYGVAQPVLPKPREVVPPTSYPHEKRTRRKFVGRRA